MTRTNGISRLLAPIVLLAAAALPASAQSYLFLAQQGEVTSVLNSGGSVFIGANKLGDQATANITIVNRGARTARLDGLELLGSSDLTISDRPSGQVTFDAGGRVTFVVQYQPTASARATATLLVSITEIIPTPAGSTAPPQNISSTLLLTINGGVPEISTAYILPDTGNTVPVGDNGTILFPETRIPNTNIVQVSVFNRGSNLGSVQNVTLEGGGDELQLLGLPLFPYGLLPAAEFRVALRYTPKKIGELSATLRVQLADRTISIRVQALATGPTFTYSLVDSDNNATPVRVGEQIRLDLPLRSTRTYTFFVKNEGNAPGSLSSIISTGTLAVTDLPPFPYTLNQGESVFFTLIASAPPSGTSLSRIRIGSDIFEVVTGSAGSRLSYSYTNADGASFPLTGDSASAGTLLFPNRVVGATTRSTFTITNTGNEAASINGIGITGSTSFRLEAPIAFPVRIEPGAQFNFNILFTPSQIGDNNGALTVDSLRFLLLGSGEQEPSLPAVRFEGTPSGNVQPRQQLPVGLSIADTYPVELRGILTAGFESSQLAFQFDSAIQFSTGGRVVEFRIPAGTRNAIFANGLPTIRFQTGTVAGNLILTPAFFVRDNVNVTPSPVPTLRLTIPPSAPVLLNFQVVPLNNSGNELQVSVTGYSTTLSLRELVLKINPVAGAQFRNLEVRYDLSGLAAVWYQSGSSSGGLFTATLTLTLSTGTAPTTGTTPPLLFVDSVDATVSNEIGTSNTLKANPGTSVLRPGN